MYSDLHWDIYPQADVAARASVAAYVRHCAEHGIEQGPAMDAGRDGLPIRVDEGVAIIPLMGPMMRRAGPIAARYGIAGTDGVRLAIESAVADDDVDQILLRIDSPGGSVSGLDQLGDAISAAKKPVTALVDGMAASAAYYVASQADRIVLGRNDLVGSIGTRMMLYDFSRQFENDGVEAVPIDTGKHKSAGALGTKITDEQRAALAQAELPIHWPSLVAAAVLAALASACWPWGFA
jgi:ClpP class serine protease